MQAVSERLARAVPTHDLMSKQKRLILTGISSLDTALDLEAAIARSFSASIPARRIGPQIVALYREVSVTLGRATMRLTGFAPAIQLGTFDMESVEDERAISEWYRESRMPAFARIPGGIRARRLVSVWGLAKLGVLYEFVSLEARLEYFERLEGRAHDPGQPTAASRTIHPAFSPSIGERLGGCQRQ